MVQLFQEKLIKGEFGFSLNSLCFTEKDVSTDNDKQTNFTKFCYSTRVSLHQT